MKTWYVNALLYEIFFAGREYWDEDEDFYWWQVGVTT